MSVNAKILSSKIIIEQANPKAKPKRNQSQNESEKPKQKRKYTKRASSRHRDVLDNLVKLCELNKLEMQFATLVVGADNVAIDDKQAKKKFLKRYLELQKPKFYVWRAETNKKGVLHFHIIHSKKERTEEEITAHWRKIQQQNKINGNSKDVKLKKLKKQKDIIKVARYTNKNVPKERREVNGNSWGSSDNLKYKSFKTKLTEQEIRKLKHLAAHNKFKVYYNEFNTVIVTKRFNKKNGRIDSILPIELELALNFYHLSNSS